MNIMRRLKFVQHLARMIPKVSRQKSKYIMPFQTYQRVFGFPFNFITVFAFIWPMKKTSTQNEMSEIENLLIEADNLFETGQYKQCYYLLNQSEHINNVNVMWRTSRVLYNIAKETIKEKTEREKMMDEAFEIINNALEMDQNNFAVHKWFAVLLDVKSGQKGIKQRIKQLSNVKKHFQRAIEINPNDATTLYMIGEWCYQIADMPWHHRQIASAIFATPPTSSYTEALDYFLKAEVKEPRFYSVNLLMLGKTYLKLNKVDQANYYLSLAASYPAKSDEDHRVNKEASDLLKK